MPNYRPKCGLIEAWQFQPDAPVPAWVARHVHAIGAGHPDERVCKDWRGILVGVKPGDYIIRYPAPDIDGVIVSGILDFDRKYEPAPEVDLDQLIADLRDVIDFESDRMSSSGPHVLRKAVESLEKLR